MIDIWLCGSKTSDISEEKYYFALVNMSSPSSGPPNGEPGIKYYKLTYCIDGKRSKFSDKSNASKVQQFLLEKDFVTVRPEGLFFSDPVMERWFQRNRY